MRSRLQLGQIRPKVSTVPRQQTEAAAYLEIYKLVNEKKRLQQELAVFEERRDRIRSRLSEIEIEITGLETTAHELRDQEHSAPSLGNRSPQGYSQSDHNTMFLEY
jgi:chromosome segregation ATPase